MLKNTATIYRNMSGDSLHKRGWRPIQVKSPLNEALAAGLLIVSGWDRSTPVVDPMCGSGTFLIEAALMAMDRAPGLGRRFALERSKDFDRRLWRDIRVAAERRAQDHTAITFEGADHHAGALTLARRAASAAGVLDAITFLETDVRDFVPSAQAPFVIVNPPYGHRLGDEDEVRDAWEGLGNFLHQRCVGGRAFVLSGSPELTRRLGLRARRKLPVRNGPIDCRLVEYEIHDRPAEAELAD